MVENPDLARSKRTKDLVKKIAKFNQELINHPDFETYIYEIGDGLSISIRK
jgi:predicted O-methyltransferase YrrM